MSAPATHPCDACGGTGTAIEYAYEPARHSARFQHHPACEAFVPGSVFACECPPPPCPVCLGAGSFPDRMPARDALADAETLRGFCDENIYSRDFPLFSSYPLIAIWKCGNSGWTVRSINRRREYEAWSRAECQARAAFRAVPGLRGE